MQLRSPRRRGAFLAAALTALVAAIVPALPVAAGTAPSDGAWVVVRLPSSSTYSPAAADQANSAGGSITVERLDVGRWRIAIPGQYPASANYGHPQVSPMGGVQAYCWVDTWYSDGPTLLIEVGCIDRQDAALDTAFALTWVHDTVTPVLFPTFGYAWLNDPSASGTPDAAYQYNAPGGSISVTRTAPGSSSFDLPSMPRPGFVAVTAYGQPAACRVVSWYGFAGSATVDTHCRTVVGSLSADRRLLLFASKNVTLAGNGRTAGAYLWASDPTASRYVPQKRYRWSSSGRSPVITRTARGVYSVTFTGQTARGAAIVSAYGTGSATCQLGSIAKSGTARVTVRCFRPNGRAADAPFTLGWVR